MNQNNKTNNLQALEQELRTILELAKLKLQKTGKLAPLVRFYKQGSATITKPINLKNIQTKRTEQARIKAVIVGAKPDMVIVVSDTWIRKPPAGATPAQLMQMRNESIAEHPDRTEALTLMGGCVDGQLILILPYTRKGKQIIFEKEMLSPEGENEFFGTAWEERAMAEGKGQVFH